MDTKVKAIEELEPYTEEGLQKYLGHYIAPLGLYKKTKGMEFLGKITCNVEEVVAGSWQEIVLDYEIGSSGVADGSSFKVTFKFYSDWALFQTIDPLAANYVSAEYQAGPLVPGQSAATVQSLKVRFDQKGHERPFQKAIIVDTVDGYLKAGDRIIVRLGDRRFGGPGTRAQTFVEKGFRFRCYVDPLGSSRSAAVPGDVKFDIVPGAAAQVQVAGSRLVRKGEPFVVRARLEDEWGNTCWNYGGELALTARLGERVIHETTLRLPENGWAVVPVADIPTTTPGDIAIEVSAKGRQAVKPATFYVTVDDKFAFPRVFYCDLHVHSDDTIGTNDTTYNLTYGRDVTGLDVLAFAHNDFNITKDKWDRTVELIHEICKEGSFIAYPGTEWCGSSCAGGDHNVVFLHGNTPEFPFLKNGRHVRSFEWNEEMKSNMQIQPGAWPLEELWAAYAHDPEGHLLIPHVGGRRCILDWHYPKLERLVEIGSSWGHFGWLYEDAMRRGHKMGASMAGDEHRGRCGGGVPGTAVFGTKGGITGVLSPSLSRKSIGEALRARHTWASTGERTVGLATCGTHLQGDEFQANGAVKIDYRFLGDQGWDEIVAYDHTGPIWTRDLQKEGKGLSASRIRLRWGGARIKDRYRWAAWKGTVSITKATINSFVGRGFEHKEEACWREGATEIGFRSDTYGDADAIEIDISDLARSQIRVQGTIDGYVKVGNPLDGNPFEHCPAFDWSVSGADLIESGRLRKDLGGTELFLAVERMSDADMPRDVAGTIEVEAQNGPHGFRPVYFFGRQVDDAKVWTSAMFITFNGEKKAAKS